VSNPKERLGYASVSEIKRHPFFVKTNWSDVILKKVKSPIIPEVIAPKPDPSQQISETPVCDIRFLLNPRNYLSGYSYNPDIIVEDEKELGLIL